MRQFPAADLLVALVFAIPVLATLGGALIAVMATRVIRSVCGLAICCVGLAGLYSYLQSPFLALMEILIYVGAICVTIVFAVMLAEPDEGVGRETRLGGLVWSGCALAISAGVSWGLVRLGTGHAWKAAGERTGTGTVEEIGRCLLTTQCLGFELISLVLLIAILGALVIARYGRTLP